MLPEIKDAAPIGAMLRFSRTFSRLEIYWKSKKIPFLKELANFVIIFDQVIYFRTKIIRSFPEMSFNKTDSEKSRNNSKVSFPNFWLISRNNIPFSER